MTEDRTANAGSRPHIPHRPPNTRGVASVIRNVFRTSVTQEELDDKARWLDGQVRGWTAARTL